MAYLIVDPTGVYPRHIVEFLGRAGKGAVAVFSSRARYLLYRDKWSKEIGQYVLDQYLAPGARSIRALSEEIGARWPKLEGVIPWDEQHVMLGAELGDRLGLGWNSAKTIERCRDKFLMKAWLRRYGKARINASAVVDDAAGAFAFLETVGRWPIVVKPTAGSGSTDVYFPASRDELLRDCQRVMGAGSGQVLLEEYIGGKELAVNGIVDKNGDVLITDIWHYDRRESHGIPNLYFQTFKIPTSDPLFGQVAHYAGQIVEGLGLRRTPIHMEVKVDDRGPCLIEVGARLSGGNLLVLGSKLHGRSLLELAACHYLAELPIGAKEIDYKRYDRYDARVVHGIQSHEIPRIRAVHGVAEVEALPSFQGFGKLRYPGMSAPLSRDLDTVAWELYLIHPDAEQVAHDTVRARQLLRYE
jgi:hypothetical protein